MPALTLLFFSALALSLLFTPACRALAKHAGLVDHPDCPRKLHTTPVPRIGGVALFLAFAGAFAVLFLAHFSSRSFVTGSWSEILRLLPAILLMFFVGLLDDLIGLQPVQKLAGEIAAAGLAVWAGVQIHRLAGLPLPVWCVIPLTVFWLVGSTNAFNLIDGVDGLAAGIGFFAAVTTLIAALLQGNQALALATAPLAGALLGFLRYNFHPASIFLGDCGSLSVGFLLGCYGVIWAHKSVTMLGMTAPLLVLAIPLLDTSLAIVRRFLRREPIFGADRGHIHHRLLARGFTPRRVALVLYSVCGIAAALSLVLSQAHDHVAGALIVVFCIGTWFAIHKLEYVELREARRMLFGDLFRRVLNDRISVRQFEDTISKAATIDDCWIAVLDASKSFGFHEAQLKVDGRLYNAQIGPIDDADCWQIRIPLPDEAFAKFTVPFDGTIQAATLAPFANALKTALGPKLQEHLDRQYRKL